MATSMTSMSQSVVKSGWCCREAEQSSLVAEVRSRSTTSTSQPDTGDTFDQSLAKGFIDLWGLPSKLAAQRDQRNG